MLHNMYWVEYRLHERFVQKSPWYWGVMLKEDEEEDGASPTPKKKELSDNEYREIIEAEMADPRDGGSYE